MVCSFARLYALTHEPAIMSVRVDIGHYYIIVSMYPVMFSPRLFNTSKHNLEVTNGQKITLILDPRASPALVRI